MTGILLKEEKVFDMVYNAVKANSNAFIQGISGIAVFPTTLAVDVLVIITHYEPMINNIRSLYGRNNVSSDDLFPVIGSILKEIIIDLAVDKVRLIMSQFRHFYAHLGNINATTIIETNQWPRVVGITGKSGKSTEGLYE